MLAATNVYLVKYGSLCVQMWYSGEKEPQGVEGKGGTYSTLKNMGYKI